MSAPKGNQFYKIRSKHGAKKLFASPKLMWEAAVEYFEWCDENPFIKIEQGKGGRWTDEDGEKTSAPELVELPVKRPYTLIGLCLYLDCSTSYFRTFKSTQKEDKQGFLTVIAKIEETIYEQKFGGAAAGFFNANIISRDLGLIDRQAMDVGLTEDSKKLFPFGQ